MKVCVLFSGGKDSTFALMKAKEEGHEIACLVTVKANSQDSYMYHLPNIHLTGLLANAMGLTIVFTESPGEKEKELIELKKILKKVKDSFKIEGVVSGAIASSYQKERVDKICKDLDLKSIAPLWHRNQKELLEEMLESGLKVIVVAIAAAGLNECWLGREINSKAFNELVDLAEKHNFNLIFEGGEAETFVVDCPLFKKRVEIVDSEKKWDGVRGEFIIKQAKLVAK